MQRGYRRLRRRLLLTLLLLALAPLMGLGLFCIDRLDVIYAEKIAANLEAVTSSKRRAVDTFLVERVAQIKNLAFTHSYAELTNPQRLSRIFSVMQSNGRSFVDLGIIDRNGRHAAYVGPYELSDANYQETEWFQEVIRKGVYVSDVFMGFRNVPHFIIAVQSHDGGNTFIVRATIDIDAIQSLLRRVYSGAHSDAFLINSRGVLQTASLHNGAIMTQSPISPPSPDKEGISVTKMNAVRPQTPESTLAALVWLESMPWALAVVDDVGETLSPLRRLRLMILLLVMVGGGVVGVGAVLATRSVIAYLAEADRKQARIDAGMLQSSKMAALGKMAAGVAHEINNPLMLIRESAGWMRDLLEEESPDNMRNHKELAETAAKIERHVDRAKGVTHRMLGFGRRMDPTRNEICVNALADQTLAFLENEAASRNIRIIKEYDPAAPAILSDPAQLQQVVLNVLDNAIDAVGKDGQVVVRTRKLPSGCALSIRDSGPGIAPDQLARIFDPFYTTKKPGEGTGLGLAICFSILEKLGGHIGVESAPGQGSTFTITLPPEPAVDNAGGAA